MSRYSSPMGAQATKQENISAFSSSMDEAMANAGIGRSDIDDLDTAMAAIADAEKLIQVQRRRIAYLESLALNDEVTGLVNRRGFMNALNRELAAAKRDQQAHGILIMFDLDDFKKINDTHGHAAGDAYLTAFGAVLSAEVRPSDIVARIGGDEFAVLLTRVANKPGTARAQAIVKSINAKAMNWRQHSLPMNVSAGVATYGSRDIAEAVLVSADLKLYANKQRRKSAKHKA